MSFRYLGRYLAAIFAVVVLLLTHTANADTIGTVVEVEGAATIAKAGGAAAAAKVNDTVDTGDILSTDAKSRLFILLADNTEWTLSENTRFRVDHYTFDSDDKTDNKAGYSIVQGGFRYVSGLIAKKDNPDVTINSPAGTIGIRGTDITVAPDTDGSYDVYVDDGAIDVNTGAGTQRLQRGQGTMIAKRGAAPLAPKDWQQGRLSRLRGALVLAREGEVRGRIRQLQPQQVKLRQKLRETIQQKRGPKLEEKKQQREEKLEQRNPQLNERQEQFEKRRAEIQKHRDAAVAKPVPGTTSGTAPNSETEAEKRAKKALLLQKMKQKKNAN